MHLAGVRWKKTKVPCVGNVKEHGVKRTTIPNVEFVKGKAACPPNGSKSWELVKQVS